jgi:hypothetical protein
MYTCSIDAERLREINGNAYFNDDIHPKAFEKRLTRIKKLRIDEHLKILNKYHELLDRNAKLPKNHGLELMSRDFLGYISHPVYFKPRQNISGIFYNTIAKLSYHDYSRFIYMAKKSVESGKIAGPDLIFITDPSVCPYQKRLSDFY